jgi:hypothetical protein
MLMDDAMGTEGEQDYFIFFPFMADPVYDGAVFSLEDIMKSATLMKLFARTTPTRNFLHVTRQGRWVFLHLEVR